MKYLKNTKHYQYFILAYNDIIMNFMQIYDKQY